MNLAVLERNLSRPHNLSGLGVTYSAPDFGVRLATPAEFALDQKAQADYKAYKATARYAQSFDGWIRGIQKNPQYAALRNEVLRRNLGFTDTHVAVYRAMRNPVTIAAKAKQAGMAAAQAKVRASKIAATQATRYAALCRAVNYGPLEDLEYSTLKLGRTTVGRDVDEPASEKREMRARMYAANRRVKLYALGLGPPASPVGYGGILYWSKELAYKKEVCGSLTPAETAKAIELGNQARAMLSKRAKDKRKSRLKKIVAVAAVVTGAVFLGPAIVSAVKGAVGAGAATGAGASKAGAAAIMKAKAAAVVKTVAVGSKVATAGKVYSGAKAISQLAAKKAASKAVATTILTRAQTLVPKVLDGVNKARTVNALVKGEIPPPPIGLDGNNFKEWGLSLAEQMLEKEMGDKLSDTQRKLAQAEMKNEMDYIAARAQQIADLEARARNLTQIPIQTNPNLSPQIIQMQQAERINGGVDKDMLTMAAVIGIPILAMVVMG